MSAIQLLGSLNSLGYEDVDNIDEESLELLFENEAMIPFLDWLCDSLHTAETLSKVEIQTYKRLEANNEVILEGEELKRALTDTSPVGQDEQLNEEELKDEIRYMKVKIDTESRDLKTYLEQRSQLNVLSDELSSRIANMIYLAPEAKNGYEERLQHAYSNSDSLDDTFEELSKEINHIIELHEDKSHSRPKRKLFTSEVDPESYFWEEEQATEAITSHTRRQFFDDISDMVSAKDRSQYQLFEISHPEFLLVRGNITEDDCKELARLQASYVDNEECYINTVCMLKRTDAMLAKTESQLSTMVLHSSDIDIQNARIQLEVFKKCYASKTKELERLFDDNLSSLLLELRELQAVKVLRGNYDLKIARQDYFTSRQDTLIKQLLLQNSRYAFVGLLYEVEEKANRDLYQLISTAAALLDASQKSSESCLSLMGSLQSTKKASIEIVNSNDHLMQELYSAFADQSDESAMRVVAFSSLHGRCDKFIGQMRKQKMSFSNLTQDQELCMSQIVLLAIECKSLIYGYIKGHQPITGSQQFSQLITKLEDVLITLGKSVDDVIRDVEKKKTLLAIDPFKALERTLFQSFFNNPKRLKRLVADLESRMDAIQSIQ